MKFYVLPTECIYFFTCISERSDYLRDFLLPSRSNRLLAAEDGTDRLSRNVGKWLPLLAA